MSIPFLADFHPSRAILPSTIRQGETMTSFLDAKQEREDLLSMARIMHHLAWCAVNEEWVNEPQQLDSMLFVASNTLPYRRFASFQSDQNPLALNYLWPSAVPEKTTGLVPITRGQLSLGLTDPACAAPAPAL